MIKIQKKDFNIEKEIFSIKSQYSNIGAVSIFVGYVRDINENKNVTSINLEVYKEMAFKKLTDVCNDAKKKWGIIDTLLIHRFGELSVNEKIVLVASFSSHRKNSFKSTEYIMEFLKKDAPFWKKEFYEKESSWL